MFEYQYFRSTCNVNFLNIDMYISKQYNEKHFIPLYFWNISGETMSRASPSVNGGFSGQAPEREEP